MGNCSTGVRERTDEIPGSENILALHLYSLKFRFTSIVFNAQINVLFLNIFNIVMFTNTLLFIEKDNLVQYSVITKIQVCVNRYFVYSSSGDNAN